MGKAHVLSLMFLFLIFPLKVFSLPSQIDPPGERLILVDPQEHRWGAYLANGHLVRSGVASAGKDWCEDMGEPCHTKVGTFRIRSLGGSGCKSPSFPIPQGGAPMPYCMYFTHAQAIHGSYEVADENLSHGCVRLHVGDAKWLRYNFAAIGTLVVVEPY